MKTNPIFERLNERARDILTGKAPHPMTGEKIDFMKSYIHRKNNSKEQIASEVIIKHRLRKNLEIYAKAKVTAEENGAFGRIDLLVEDQHGDQEIIEVKKKKTKPDDVLQTFKYLLFKKNIKTAKLMAPEHSDDSTTIVKEINAFLTHSGQKILLETLDDHLTNPSLSESEKNFLNNT